MAITEDREMNRERNAFARRHPSGIDPGTSVWALGGLRTMPKDLEFPA